MLVLHVVAPGAIGGLERVVQLVAQGQARAGNEVHVAGVLDQANADHPLLHALTAGGVTTHAIILPRRSYWRERAAIRELGRRLRPDVVHTHGYRPDVVDAGAAQRLGIPIVTTVHGFTGGDWKNRLYERLQRRVYRTFDAVVGVSRPLVARLIRDGVPAHRVHVVQNAWQETAPPLDRAAARLVLGIPADGFVVGWIGRLSHEKGPDVLLEALHRVTDLPLVVSVVGGGIERAALQARARRLGLEGILWHGAVPDADRLFRAFDVVVLSSRTEGSPMVLFEAMAAEVPVVATRVGGVPDIVSSAEAALVPPNDPGALAAALRAVYRDQGQARARARRARERLRREFRIEPWLARYEAIYRKLSRPALAGVAG